MNNFKIKFSDVLRYFILGGIEVLLYYWIVEKTDSKCMFGDNFSEVSTVHVAVAIIGIYLLGFVTQSIIQLFWGGNFLGTGLGEVAEFVRFYPTLNRNGYPDWLYWSDRPKRVLEIYRNILETDENAETKTEFLYSNQLFQGISFALLAATIYAFLGTCTSIISVKIALLFVFLFILWAIHWFCVQSRAVIITILMGVVFMPIFVCLLGTVVFVDSLLKGCLLAVLYLISTLLAANLARMQIRRIDILARFSNDNTKNQMFREVLARVGVPKFYILTRTNSAKYISEELHSITTQTYPNIKIIVLLDASLQEPNNQKERDALLEKIDAFRGKLNIQTYESSKTGPAQLAYEIRQIFLDYANSDDVAMILDSDDKLYSPSVVSQIMTKLFKTQSNICLIRFEIFGKQNLNYSKNHHNDLVKFLCFKGDASKDGISEAHVIREGLKAERTKSISAKELIKWNELHRISTIGWTKCYRKGILSGYHRMTKKYLDTNEKLSLDKRKYEDFPDIVAILQSDAKICAVAKNSVLFRKSENSVTTSVTSNNYSDQIPFFLHFAKELAANNKFSLIDGGDDVITNKLIPYKFVQYLNVVHKKTTTPKGRPGYDENLVKEQYNCDKYYRDFMEEVFCVDIAKDGKVSPKEYSIVNAFHNNVISLLAGEDYNILGGFPSGITKGPTWENISRIYQLTQVSEETSLSDTSMNDSRENTTESLQKR